MSRRFIGVLLCAACLALGATIYASDPDDPAGGSRVDSRYTTLWLDPAVSLDQVNRRISVWWIRPQVKVSKEATLEDQLGAKCDTIFRRVEEVLDMYPPGIHVTIRVLRNKSQLESVHEGQYGFGTDAIAFYLFETNTVYVGIGDLSEDVLAHEMAHAIIDHYFGVRPPRKVEEMLAMYADEHLRD